MILLLYDTLIMEIPGGRGEQPEALWNGKSGGGGAQTVNNPPWGGYGYFLELHNLFYFIRLTITFHICMGSLPLGDKDEEKYKNVLFL